MKKIIFVATLLYAFCTSQGQTFDEWFHQKETQIKYLTEQIVALKAYEKVVLKGYGITREGLSSITQEKKGDYQQHEHHFQSLQIVSIPISEYPKNEQIRVLYTAIQKQKESSLSIAKESGFITAGELNYFTRVLESCMADCTSLLSELKLVTTNFQYQLSDDERLKRIDSIFLNMQDQLMFCRNFSHEIKLLILNRFNEQGELEVLQELHAR